MRARSTPVRRAQPDRPPVRGGVGGVPAAVDRGPLGRRPAVVERRLAHELHLDATLEALHRAHEHVVGIVIGGRTGVRRHLVLVIPRPHRQRIAHAHPARRRLPRRHQHIRARLVGPRRRMGDAEGAEPEEPRLPVEQAAEHARCVEGRDAQPVDRAVGRNQSARVAVRQERVLRDRRERRGRRRTLRLGVPGRPPRLR